MASNEGRSAILAPLCFIETHPLIFIFVYTLWILGLVQEGIYNLLNISIAPWVVGNLVYSMFFHEWHILRPAAEAMLAEEGEEEAGSEEDEATLERPQLMKQWRLERLERMVEGRERRVEMQKGILERLERRIGKVDRELERVQWRGSTESIAEAMEMKRKERNAALSKPQRRLEARRRPAGNGCGT